MDNKIIKFLDSHRVGSLTTTLLDGSPHASAIHYSHSNNPFILYFSTANNSKKCEGLLKGEIVKASVAIGFSEEEWVTLQLDGEIVAISDKEELKAVQDIHYAKHPHSAKYKDDPTTLFLKFTPKWWRYSDYNTNPLTIIESK